MKNNSNVIIGIGGLVHDASLTYLVDGIPKVILEEERIIRQKHIGGSWKASSKILNDKFKFDINNATHIAIARKNLPKIWEKKNGNKIGKFLKQFNQEKIHRIDHHLAHASSSFYPSGFKKAVILTVDAIGDDVATWAGYGENNKIKEFFRINYLHSLGFLWIRTCKILGYPDIFSAGKIMALASFGKPKYYKLFKSIINFKKEGSYELIPGKYDWKEIARFWKEEKPFFIQKELGIKPRKLNVPIKQIYFDIAASLQKITEEVIIHMVNNLYKRTKCENLCLAGGVFLNGYVNQKIFKKTKFKNIFVQPAASDTGDGLGASLYLYHHILKNPRKWKMENAHLGMDFSEKEILNALNKNKVIIKYIKDSNIEKTTAKLISEEKIIGWFQGKAEFGPRALGNRSILADPRNFKTKNILNDIKDREWFRPVAPSIIEEECNNYFDIYFPSIYMIFIGKVKRNKRKLIPAITHIDNSARVQTVNKKDNPIYYKLLKEFQKITKVPVLCNTSFNKRDEPIVNSPEDAIKTFLRSPKIDYLVLGNYLIERK